MKMATFEARRPSGMAHQFIEGIKMDHYNFCVPNSQGLWNFDTIYIYNSIYNIIYVYI